MMHDADEKDIAFLVSNLQSNKPEPGTLEELNHNFPAALSLGTLIQPYYSTFLNLYQQIILDESLNNEFILEKGLNDQIRNQERAILNKEAELVMANQAVFLVNGNLQRHQNLYSKGILSKVDLEKVEMESLAEERQIQFLEQQLNELVSVLKGLEYRQQLSKNMEFRNASLQKSELSLARQDLLNAIAQWEELYLFKSPIQGTLTFFDVWGKFQNLKPGEDIFTITPFGSQILIAKCSLPVANSGKLQKGQKGVIKLKNYPFREWGVLKARVETISGISRKGEEPGYVVYLKMDDLVTSYGKKLDFEQELLGTAEIILEETTVLGRIFNDFRHLWSGRQI
ncbi:HlyD family efflux transporter periplasmic adaptor subunit [Salinimicrobium sp. CAU 1759]